MRLTKIILTSCIVLGNASGYADERAHTCTSGTPYTCQCLDTGKSTNEGMGTVGQADRSSCATYCGNGSPYRLDCAFNNDIKLHTCTKTSTWYCQCLDSLKKVSTDNAAQCATTYCPTGHRLDCEP